MQLADVMAVTAALRARGIGHWVAGGWGVDALVGRQTRAHRDLDLAVVAERLADAVAALTELGYQPETDWLPVRLELAAPGGRWVDLHPVAFDAAGDGRQSGLAGTTFGYPAGDLVLGSVDGLPMPCISVALQRVFHAGYPLRAVDEADLAVLADAERSSPPRPRSG